MLARAGLELVNVDCTVVIEAAEARARTGAAIRERLAGALGLAAERVNVKATTGERMGFVGRGEGVAALAVASLHGRADATTGGRGATTTRPTRPDAPTPVWWSWRCSRSRA